MNKKHDFNFAGGKYLRHIGASFFVIYTENPKNSFINIYSPKSLEWRIKYFEQYSPKYKKIWLENILKMNDKKFRNKMGICGHYIKEKATKLLGNL